MVDSKDVLGTTIDFVDPILFIEKCFKENIEKFQRITSFLENIV